ncbi:low affinity iron permease family protein [soil metagenome]
MMDKLFAKFANATAKATGSPVAFLLCVAAVLIWAISGPIFKFSETWQLVINTGTTIVTFLMVFLIQNTQNRDGAALQTKLDELIRASDAHDEFMGIEKLTDRELEVLHARCNRDAQRSAKLAAKAQAEQTSRSGRKSISPKAKPKSKAKTSARSRGAS